MNRMKKVCTIIVLVIFIQCGVKVQAADTASIMEAFTGENSVSLYVKGIAEEMGDISVQIGTSTGTVTAVESITKREVPMRTLVMIDNSISIKQEDREKIADFLQNLISDRENGEELAITTFSEGMAWLTEYTGDYSTLKQAVDGIEYQDQETYLTDVLYDLTANEFSVKREDVYHRLIIVSDGVDNKSLGYTKEELYSLIKENTYPIYTVGCANEKNNEELENMFALSRMTGVEAFLLSEVENTLDITDRLKEDRRIVKLEILPSPEVMDGSRKTVRLSFGKGSGINDLSADVTMPQQTRETDGQPEPKEEPKEESKEEPVEPAAPVQEETDQSGMMKMAVFIVIFCFALVAAVIVLIIRLLTRRRREKTKFEVFEDSGFDGSKSVLNPTEKTELVHEEMTGNGEDTFCIWGSRNTYNIVMTDTHSAVKSFQVPLERSIIVGRKQGVCNIVLDYDKSVSNRHCEIAVRDGKFYIKDLQSSNGTFVNGSRVISEVEIFSGNIVKLGRLEMKFEVR